MTAEEKQILDHEPVPGYRTAFFVVAIIAVVYLIWIFCTATSFHH